MAGLPFRELLGALALSRSLVVGNATKRTTSRSRPRQRKEEKGRKEVVARRQGRKWWE